MHCIGWESNLKKYVNMFLYISWMWMMDLSLEIWTCSWKSWTKRKDLWYWLGMAPDLIAQTLWISLFKAWKTGMFLSVARRLAVRLKCLAWFLNYFLSPIWKLFSCVEYAYVYPHFSSHITQMIHADAIWDTWYTKHKGHILCTQYMTHMKHTMLHNTQHMMLSTLYMKHDTQRYTASKLRKKKKK